jgi:hypothetical protein
LSYRHPSTSYDGAFLGRKAIMEQTWQPHNNVRLYRAGSTSEHRGKHPKGDVAYVFWKKRLSTKGNESHPQRGAFPLASRILPLARHFQPISLEC